MDLCKINYKGLYILAFLTAGVFTFHIIIIVQLLRHTMWMNSKLKSRHLIKCKNKIG